MHVIFFILGRSLVTISVQFEHKGALLSPPAALMEALAGCWHYYEMQVGRALTILKYDVRMA